MPSSKNWSTAPGGKPTVSIGKPMVGAVTRLVITSEIHRQIGQENTQRLERTNPIVRQLSGRWHRRQNKFAKIWEQTKVINRLVVSYVNWIWVHHRCRTTAAQRAGLTDCRWTWNDWAIYLTFHGIS